MEQNQKIRQALQYKNIEIRLFEVDRREIPYESVANIIAVDSLGNTVWQVERPRTNREQYWDMNLDTSNNVLIANTGSGYRHHINLDNGKILDAYLVK